MRIKFYILFFASIPQFLLGQQREIKAVIEGYPAIGTVQFYSNSRILLKLDRDGDWPRQITWEIRENSTKRCTITFNKVGWQYTATIDTCGIDWVHAPLTPFTFKFKSTGNYSRIASLPPSTGNEGILLNRTLGAPTPLPPTKSSEELNPQSVITNSSSIQNNAYAEKPILESTIPAITSQAPQSETPAAETVLNNDTSSDDLVVPQPAKRDSVLLQKPIEIENEPVSKALEENVSSSTHSASAKEPEFKLSEAKEPEIRPLIDSSLENSPLKVEEQFAQGNAVELADDLSSLDSLAETREQTSETPEYIFTIPPRRKRVRRSPKKSSKERLTENVSMEPTAELNFPPEDSSRSLLPVPSKDSIPKDSSEKPAFETDDPYKQVAPFISVASFETLEYAESVKKMFECPGGCIIVRSEKGLYYRIGFYPDPDQISVDLRQTRLKYSDAWLVKLF